MNNVSIICNLTKDIELRTVSSGKSVVNTTVAYNDGYGDKQQTYYFDVQVWGTQAENLAKYCSKGSKIAVSGKLIQQSWEHEGKKQSKVLIQADRVVFLDSKKTSGQAPAELSQAEIIKSAMNEESDPFKEFGQEVQLTDDDLPF